MAEAITCTQADATWILTLNRPERLNAIDLDVCARLSELVRAADSNPNVRALIITGEGRAFSAGADISILEALPDGAAFRTFLTGLTDAYRLLETAATPSIAAINGAALGGGLELALSCDFRIATRMAKLGLPEIALGLLPGAGGTQRLPRLAHAGVARRMLLTGAPVTADEALAAAIIDEVVDIDDLMPTAQRLASTLVACSPAAVAAAKRLLDEGPSLGLEAAIKLEREVVSGLFDGSDRIEGLAAFRERRVPRF